MEVTLGGNLITRYWYDARKLTKPVLYPVLSAEGTVMNRSFPFGKVEGESKDHPHHTGIFFTYDRVNGQGFWNNTTFPPQIRHAGFLGMEGGDGSGRLGVIMNWTGKQGEVLLLERRIMTFRAGNRPSEWMVDFDMTLTAQDEAVVFDDTKEGMFAIRTASWLREKKGSGAYLDAEGRKGEREVWGRRSPWVRLEGKHDGKSAGLAILNHPSSVNYPTYWHARGYGLFAANPLGQGVFEKSRGAKDAKPLMLTLRPGESAHFVFRILVYEGDRKPADFQAMSEAYSGDAR